MTCFSPCETALYKTVVPNKIALYIVRLSHMRLLPMYFVKHRGLCTSLSYLLKSDFSFLRLKFGTGLGQDWNRTGTGRTETIRGLKF